MSALGHKQTYAVHQPMSALPPKSGHSFVGAVMPSSGEEGPFPVLLPGNISAGE